MKKCSFLKARFQGSFLTDFPEYRSRHGDVLPEIAVVGRSNVGKSSLINHLLNDRTLARVSSNPGKTQTVNFFKVDDDFILADLPGYGYARRPQDIKISWAEAIDNYLKARDPLKLILFLIDARRDPTEDDVAFVKWAAHFRKPLLLIFTKSDTLTPHEQKNNQQKTLAMLAEIRETMHYSIKDAHSRKILQQKINSSIYGTT